ncbi:hypothetical protein [Nocardioides sp. SYSU D00065]|uniref:hypothetical protein n=1 Tax=Nocardioides sp. SYSU D00065 TaxID=2817378 RepID=UPI001B333558|nr:hypothetical protein [Nocardioides sp. SYSU D00065]
MHVRRALAVTLVAPLLLAGCTDEAEPTPKMPDPTTSSPASTPTETETAEQESPEEFIRRWVKAGDEMQVTGATEEYDRMAPRCEPCQAFVDNVRKVYADGGSAEFAGSRVVSMVRRGSSPPTYDVTKVLPETIIKSGDGRTETLPGGRTTIRVTLGLTKGVWTVTHFGIL